MQLISPHFERAKCTRVGKCQGKGLWEAGFGNGRKVCQAADFDMQSRKQCRELNLQTSEGEGSCKEGSLDPHLRKIQQEKMVEGTLRGLEQKMQHDASKHISPMANPSLHLAYSFDFTEVQGKKKHPQNYTKPNLITACLAIIVFMYA